MEGPRIGARIQYLTKDAQDSTGWVWDMMCLNECYTGIHYLCRTCQDESELIRSQHSAQSHESIHLVVYRSIHTIYNNTSTLQNMCSYTCTKWCSVDVPFLPV